MGVVGRNITEDGRAALPRFLSYLIVIKKDGGLSSLFFRMTIIVKQTPFLLTNFVVLRKKFKSEIFSADFAFLYDILA